MPDKSLTDRRRFLVRAAATAIVGGAVAACTDGAPKVAAASTLPPAKPALSAAETMDKMHEAGVKAFPAKTAGKGNQLLPPRIEKGVKIFELTAEKIQWETAPGQMVEAWAYNKQVPGPQIRVREGDRVRVILHNKLEQSTAIHFHGLELPNSERYDVIVNCKSAGVWAFHCHILPHAESEHGMFGMVTAVIVS